VITVKRVGLCFGFLLFVFFCAAVATAQEAAGPIKLATTLGAPHTFGTKDETVTTVAAIGFYPETSTTTGSAYDTSGSKGRYGAENVLTHFWAPLDLPAGAIIDFIGLNNDTDTPGAFSVQLLKRHSDGTLTTIGAFSSTAHGWDTDFTAAPIGYLWEGKSGDALLMQVDQEPNPNLEFFGWVEVWWRRSVSPAPATPTFNDVGPADFGYQQIEALAASGITGGCGGGSFCPNNPLTRAQMAVFLAKALGLHWPGVHNP
jgi:hypothetical protein